MDRPGHGDADPEHGIHGERAFPIGLLDQPAHELGRVLRRVVGLEVDRLVREHRMRDVGDDDLDMLEPHENADAGAGLGIEGQECRRPAHAHAARQLEALALDDDAGAAQFAQRCGNCGFREAGRARDFRRAEPAPFAQSPDDAACRRADVPVDQQLL
jgi:hypothetical protein